MHMTGRNYSIFSSTSSQLPEDKSGTENRFNREGLQARRPLAAARRPAPAARKPSRRRKYGGAPLAALGKKRMSARDPQFFSARLGKISRLYHLSWIFCKIHRPPATIWNSPQFRQNCIKISTKSDLFFFVLLSQRRLVVDARIQLYLLAI